MKHDNRTARLNARIYPELMKRVKKSAKRNGASLSKMVELALEYFLREVQPLSEQ